MLQPYLARLRAERIVLASGSSRRREILENIGLKLDIVPSSFEENLDKSTFAQPSDYVLCTALMKAQDTAKSLLVTNTDRDSRLPFLIISADTVAHMDGQIYEKPRSKEDAFKMLSSFVGRSHKVCTGVTILKLRSTIDISVEEQPQYDIEQFHAETVVNFDETIDDSMIWAYIESGEPMDKAGGYGIQAMGGTLITGIIGDYFNVEGFPLNMFARHLVKMLHQTSVDPTAA